MSIFKKFFQPVRKSEQISPSELLTKLPNGKYAFNLNLFSKTISTTSANPASALVLLLHIIKEIGEGKELVEYDGIAVAHFMIVDQYADLGDVDGICSAISSSGLLYDRYSAEQRSLINNQLASQEAAKLVFDIFRILSASFPKQAQIDKAVQLLKSTTEEIEEKGEPHGTERILTYNNLSHDDVSRGYTQLAVHLQRWGQPHLAWEVTIPNICPLKFYGKLSKARRENLHHILNSLFPEAYPQLKAEVLDPAEELIHQTTHG